jgi:hypothetical protein
VVAAGYFSLPVPHPKGKFLGGLRTTEESVMGVCIDANMGLLMIALKVCVQLPPVK